MFSAIAGLFSSIFSGLFSDYNNQQNLANQSYLVAQQAKYNSLLAEQAFNYQTLLNKDQFKYQTELNQQGYDLSMRSLVEGPKKQLTGIQQAGLSPALMNQSTFTPIGANSGSASAGSAPQASVGLGSVPDASSGVGNLSSLVSSAVQALKAKAEIKNLEADADKKEAEADESKSRTEGNKLDNWDKSVNQAFVASKSQEISNTIGTDKDWYFSPSALESAEKVVKLPAFIKQQKLAETTAILENLVRNKQLDDPDVVSALEKMPHQQLKKLVADTINALEEGNYHKVVAKMEEEGSIKGILANFDNPNRNVGDWFKDILKVVVLSLAKR